MTAQYKTLVTLEMIQNKPASFINWLFTGINKQQYRSRNRENLQKKLDQLNTSVTIETLTDTGLIKRIAPLASQEHYERCIHSK